MNLEEFEVEVVVQVFAPMTKLSCLWNLVEESLLYACMNAVHNYYANSVNHAKDPFYSIKGKGDKEEEQGEDEEEDDELIVRFGGEIQSDYKIPS
ncbi:hypothetical protein Bca52824_031321 [Brassica carinata]|uniref:Uncharacterized protein n=1 Tax=Brassica carinata TaxID=52824 RepID=A0A8X7V435_BRACI|nr:hypothetical protein Bca52824_031321 [Brassica carinata]